MTAENPTIMAKENVKSIPTDQTKRLFRLIYDEVSKKPNNDDIPKIKVSTLISKMSFYYEKIRNYVDYEEEHLLRKNAIERTLRRQIIIEGVIKEQGVENMSSHLLTELIRAGYLPNDEIPESKIGEIEIIINKYLILRKILLPQVALISEEVKETARWVIAMCASEIEEKLSDNQVTKHIVNQMYEILASAVELPKDLPYEKDREIQIYIGVHRVYLKFDRDMLEFQLLKYFNANWPKASEEDVIKIAQNIELLREAINKQIDHPLVKQFNKIISSYTVYFSILEDVIRENPASVYDSFSEDPKAFARTIKKICDKRYKLTKVKLRRAAFRSIIYIFLTKMVLAIILEVPVTIWLGEVLNYMSLAINISFPPLLLFLIVLFTRVPSNANTQKIKEGIESIVFKEKEKQDPIRLKKPVKRGKITNSILGGFYFATFIFTFGLVVWALNKIHFNFVSIVIFLFFLTLVSFFSIRIRRGPKEMFVTEQKENFFVFIMDFFYVPIVAVGKWLNEKFSRLNVFVFLLDFIIEAPFKMFVEITEEWTKYVKERKEDIM